MSSIPSQLPELRLAVKRSEHPPAKWCHSKAKPGKWVKLSLGLGRDWENVREGTGNFGVVEKRMKMIFGELLQLV